MLKARKSNWTGSNRLINARQFSALLGIVEDATGLPRGASRSQLLEK